MRKLPRPKLLTLSGIWDLYKLISPYLPDKSSALLIDEIESILDKVPRGFLKSCLGIMYGDKFDISIYSPIDVLLLFIRGIKKNNFFLFVEYIRAFRDGTS